MTVENESSFLFTLCSEIRNTLLVDHILRTLRHQIFKGKTLLLPQKISLVIFWINFCLLVLCFVALAYRQTQFYMHFTAKDVLKFKCKLIFLVWQCVYLKDIFKAVFWDKLYIERPWSMKELKEEVYRHSSSNSTFSNCVTFSKFESFQTLNNAIHIHRCIVHCTYVHYTVHTQFG